jgi:transposase
MVDDRHTTNGGERESGRRSAALALGLDPSVIAWPDRHGDGASAPPPALDVEQKGLSDQDWDSLAPLLPSEAPQAKAMSNRDFIDAVLDAMSRRGSWTSRHTPAAEVEAVRRRFGRWAHRGVFQFLAIRLPNLVLSPDTKALLALAGERAARLKRCAR